MKYRAILFDFDGTLVPSLPLWLKAFREALAHYGITILDDEVVHRCFYRAWNEVAMDFGLRNAEDFPLRVETGLRHAFLEAELYPFARDVLIHCRKHEVFTALVTSSPRSVLAEAIVRLRLHGLFDFTISGDDVHNYKPHPEPLLTSLGALGLTASEAIMVGDSEADIRAGKAAGTSTVLFVPYDYARFNSPDVMQTTEPDMVFSDFVELPRMLGLSDMSK